MFIFASQGEYLEYAVSSLKEVAEIFFDSKNCFEIFDQEFAADELVVCSSIQMRTQLEVVKFLCTTSADSARLLMKKLVDEHHVENEKEMIKDFVSEVANTLVGSIQKKISESQIQLSFGLPKTEELQFAEANFFSLNYQYLTIDNCLFLISVERESLETI